MNFPFMSEEIVKTLQRIASRQEGVTAVFNQYAKAAELSLEQRRTFGSRCDPISASTSFAEESPAEAGASI